MTDPFDEIEYLTLELLPPPRLEEKRESTPEPTEEISPLVRVFQERNIRILGTIDDPLFCAADTAAYINDDNYARKIARYTRGEYLQLITTATARRQQRQMQYLTEAGLYKYLLQSKGEIAEEFQRFVYQLLKEERKRTVDSTKLALKIAQTKAEELRRENAALAQEKAALVRKQSSLYVAANDAREESMALKKKVKSLQKSKYAAADAEEMRLCGRQVEQIPGWNC